MLRVQFVAQNTVLHPVGIGEEGMREMRGMRKQGKDKCPMPHAPLPFPPGKCDTLNKVAVEKSVYT